MLTAAALFLVAFSLFSLGPLNQPKQRARCFPMNKMEKQTGLQPNYYYKHMNRHQRDLPSKYNITWHGDNRQ
jgi:hypothetical protein